MNETLIKVDKVYKKYCRDLKRSMLYGLHDVVRDILNITADSSRMRTAEFMALRDVSLELERGEVLGIIGSNGAGKSTMLKLISGIILPDAGSVKTRGKVGELIEITAGFHPMLTGRENIYVKAAILGMRRKEIDNAFDDIVDFAELDDFIDTPVKYYSSGMHMRLGFAVIVHSRPDILAVDEILSVGDAGFRAKSFNRINELTSDAGIIFVSHNMADVSRICNKVMVLNKGECIYYGNNIPSGIDCYYREFATSRFPAVSGRGGAILHELTIQAGKQDQTMTVLGSSEDLKLNLTVSASMDVSEIELVITINNFEQQPLIQANSHFDGVKLKNNSQRMAVNVNLGRIYLNPGVYGITVNINRENRGEVLAKYTNYLLFRVVGGRIGYSSMQIPAIWNCSTDYQ